MRTPRKPILLVEDDEVDIMTIQRALRQLRVSNPVVAQEDGERALAWLRDPATEEPWIILLDLNMPVMSGIEFLEVVKNDDELKRFPVIVLTTSEEPQDKVNSFNFSVAGYMTKPLDHQQFVEVMRSIHVYWSVSEIP